MSLLPRALQFRDEALSLPLGAAKVKPVAVKVDPVITFEVKCHFRVGEHFVREADCRQIKGAAKPASREVAPIGRPADAAPPSTEKPPKFKPGDRVRMTYQRGVVAVGTVVHEAMAFPGEWHCRPDDGLGCFDGVFHPDQLELIPSEPKEADGLMPQKGRVYLCDSTWGKTFSLYAGGGLWCGCTDIGRVLAGYAKRGDYTGKYTDRQIFRVIREATQAELE